MYIHLRLTDVFQTQDHENGWFGQKHIIVFGDLLQLPPVFQKPVFETLTAEESKKIIGSMSSINIWQKLFQYEELTINMRQKQDPQFAKILDRLRIGALQPPDIALLEDRKVAPSDDELPLTKHLAQYILSLPSDTVCLLPTRAMCQELNTSVMQEMQGEFIALEAEDSVDCSKQLKKKVDDMLKKTRR